ncbi:MAG: MgtC/SapB family protein [Candidatus Aenigmarchaeota archaeon]|nr:MgtC/SapB family protein [Candidatus Aenigmarchaeota archaeon]
MVFIESEVISKIIIAAFIGGVLGFERELSKKPADMRTSALVCIGAALFGVIASFQDSNSLPLYPGVAAGIVTGLGFLGAGMIFKEKDQVRGLTTATEVWVIGAIGLAVGLEMYEMAVAAAVIVLLIQLAGKEFEKITLRRK